MKRKMGAEKMKILFFLLLLMPVLALAGNTEKRGYNVLLITVDTWRFDRVSINDRRFVDTPAIDAFARKSQIFNRAFAHNPVTLPSHVNIMTGTTPLFHGISDNSGFRLDDRFLTLARYLKSYGYKTAAFIGAFPLDSRFGLDQGFDVYDDFFGTHNSLEFFFAERPAEKVIQPAIKWLSAAPQKWFAWIHLFDPHQPYLPPSPFREKYSRDPYSGEVAYVDSQLKILFDFLEKKGLANRTVVILTGDHGEALGEKGEQTHSYFAYNNTIHIPLFIRVPDLPPKTIAENVCHTDIFPTVCEMLGLGIPAQVQGESLLPVIKNGKRKNPLIYFQSLTAYLNRGWAPLHGFINGNIKFIDLPVKEVYDLSRDPAELQNIAKTSPIGQLKNSLLDLQKKLKNRLSLARSGKIDPDIQKKMKSLGYLSEAAPVAENKVFSEKDDLKTLLPLQNKLLNGVAVYQSGNLPEAERLIKDVIGASPTFILAYNHLATIYVETGRPGEAIQVLEQGLKANPGHISLLSKLGIIKAESGNPLEAVTILEGCIQKISFDPENFNFLGIAYYRSGNFPKALENYRKALDIDPNYASVYNNMGSLYLSDFLKTKEAKSLDSALANLKKAIAIDPKMAAAFNGLGAVYRKLGQDQEAIKAWEKALDLKPDFDMPLINLGITWLENGNAKKALEVFLRYKDKFFHKLPESEKKRIDRLIAEARSKS